MLKLNYKEDHLPDTGSITQVVLSEGYELVAKKKIRTYKPKFTLMGDKMDLVEIITTLNKAEQQIVLRIRKNIVYDVFEDEYYPIVRIKPTEEGLTKTQLQTFGRALKKLKTKGIIAKTSPYNYMINPDMLVPHNYAKYKRLWDSVTEEVVEEPADLFGKPEQSDGE